MLGVDTGGTFTDFVALQKGELKIAKIPSTPHNPAAAILSGALLLAVDESASVKHGTTVATNAILERKVAKTALITNAGLEHVLLIGRQTRAQLYGLTPQAVPPLIPRSLCFGLKVRRDASGRVIDPLSEREVRDLAKLLQERDVEAVAVGLLHAYRNAEDEQRVGDLLTALLPGVHVSLSSDVLPVFREVERFTTTVMNASVTPKVSRYVAHLSEGLGKRPLYLMQSNGGTLLPAQVSTQSIRLALSGPAGGAVAAMHLARAVLRTERPNILTLDMGGTSTDVALCPGTLPYAQNHEMSGLPLAVPVIDIHTVGAGGGSLVHLDAAGALQVGPKSAGASPGPICYNKGGTELTVTDANLFLGRLHDDWALGSEGEIRPDRAGVALALQKLAAAMSLTQDQVAQGILDVVNEHMVHALAKVSIQQGFDPKDFTLIPFGGAGPLHMCALAERLGMTQILVPPTPGVFSAVGLLLAERRLDQVKSVLVRGDDAALPALLLDLMEGLRHDLLAGFQPQERGDVKFQWELQMRYPGQSHEIGVPLPEVQALGTCLQNFHERHHAMNGWQKEASPEIVTLRGTAVLTGPDVTVPRITPVTEPQSAAAKVYDGGWREVLVAHRNAISNEISGPALLVQEDATIWIATGWTAAVHESGALVVTRKEEAS